MIYSNTKAPDFSLPDQHGVIHTLSEYLGKKVLIYFYPKDNTPGCTTEACSFRDSYKELSASGLVVLGVSKDSVKSHKKFADDFELPFPILSDDDAKVCQLYGVFGMKKFIGKEYMGISRNSFLIDEKGFISKIYEDVKPKEHVGQVSKDVKF